MRDIRPGTAGPRAHSNQRPHMQYLAHLASQSRGHAGAAQVLKQRSKPPEIGPRKLAQKLLGDVGLSGAAHPIRRLEHPGGRMVFPFGGRGGRLRAAGRAGVTTAATLGWISVGLKGKTGTYPWEVPARWRWNVPGSPEQQSLPPKRSDDDIMQEVEAEGDARRGFLDDVRRLRRTGQITDAQAGQAHDWAIFKADTAALRAERNRIHKKYRLPSLKGSK